ncbi:MAG: MFS transporter [Dehalococcoidia bacterium]|nr:MFS transporter [Dehalococcoidia bacterium]
MDRTLSLKNKLLFLSLFCITVFIAADDQTVIVTLLPSMILDLRISVGELNKVSWTITSYLLGFTLIMPIAGKICDKYGYKSTLIISLLIFSFGSLMIGMTNIIPNSPFLPSKLLWMVFFRFIQAMGGGAIIPVCMVGISLIFEKKYWIYGFGLIGASAELGGVIGPLWGSLIVEYWNWETAFLINIPISFGIIFLMYFLPNSQPSKARIKIFDAILFSVVIILTTYLISEYSNLTSLNLVIIISIIFLLCFFIYRVLKGLQDFIPPEIFKYKTFIISFSTHFFIGASLIIIMVTIPLSSSTIHEMGNLEIGLSLLNLTLFIGVGSIIGILLSKFSNFFSMNLAGVITSIGILLYSINISKPPDDLAYIFFIVGTGFGLYIVPIHNLGLEKIPVKIRGIASSMISFSRMTGMIFGLSIMTAFGTSRFSELVSGIQIFTSNSKEQKELINNINIAGIEVFQELIFGALIFSVIALVLGIIIQIDYLIKKNKIIK